MPHDWLPSKENELLLWSANFDARLNTPPGPGVYGVSNAMASAYTPLHQAFAAGHANATNATANSKANIIAKNHAKAALKSYARMLARLIRATPSVTNDMRGLLGLTIPDLHLTPAVVPDRAPIVSVMSTSGRIVRIKLWDPGVPSKRGHAPGIAGAAILSWAASSPAQTQPPPTRAGWTFHGNATRKHYEVCIDSHVPAGTKVWIAAMWYNPRGQLGPMSKPQITYIGEGVVFAQAA